MEATVRRTLQSQPEQVAASAQAFRDVWRTFRGPGQESVFHGGALGQIDFVICFYSEIMQLFLGSSTNKVVQASDMLM